MYAWVATEQYAGVLVTLNITSGERIKTIVSFPEVLFVVILFKFYLLFLYVIESIEKI